jgi:hypothetical protein
MSDAKHDTMHSREYLDFIELGYRSAVLRTALIAYAMTDANNGAVVIARSSRYEAPEAYRVEQIRDGCSIVLQYTSDGVIFG